MPTGHKIALFGIGSIGRLAYSGIDALTLSETKNEKFDFDILTITEPADYSTLVKAYKEVKQKYNPEKDILIKIER